VFVPGVEFVHAHGCHFAKCLVSRSFSLQMNSTSS
jgi:hypothetical protein